MKANPVRSMFDDLEVVEADEAQVKVEVMV